MGKEIHKFIDLSKLPRNYKGIDWINTIGNKIYFEYDNIKDWIEIINYKKDTRILIIKYNDKEFEIFTGNLKKCRFGSFLNKKTSEFKIEIGQTFKDDKRDLIIIDRKITKNKSGEYRKYYKYNCNKCGFNGSKHWSIKDKCYKDELWIREDHLLHEVGCSCCSNTIVVKGINDIYTVRNDSIKYFVNKKDIYTHTINSKEKALFRCLDCGYEKLIQISLFYKYGFSCPKCSDGISYPEKIMIGILSQLNMNFIYQYSKTNNNWCNTYKYDFYFKLNGEEYIIETHGGQHYKECTNFKMSLEEIQENDKNKKELALKNGIKEENYIIINCKKSELEWVKNNILHSRLNDIFDLNNIDWIKIEECATKNLVKHVCDYWSNKKEDETTLNVAFVFKIDKHTVIKYLKIGSKLGWCKYNPNEEKYKIYKKQSRKNKLIFSKEVEIFKDDISLGIFESVSELERQSEKIFGIILKRSSIESVCKGNKPQYKGYTFKYVDEIHKEFKPKLRKPVEIFKNNISLGVFSSCSDLEKQSEKLFEIKFISEGISNACRNNKQYKGFTFKYITSDEYYQRISEDPTLKESEQAS